MSQPTAITTITFVLLLSAAIWQQPLYAQSNSSPYFASLNVAHIQYDNTATLKTASGRVIPGAKIDIPSTNNLIMEFGYQLTSRVDIRTAIGVPPKVSLYGEGSLANIGKLGTLTFAPFMLTATYNFDLGNIKPYVGAGISYIYILESNDGALEDVSAKNKFGTALQAGVEIPINNSWSAVIDARKVFWKTNAKAITPELGNMSVKAEVEPSPFIIMLGIIHHF